MSTLKEKTLFDILNAIFLKTNVEYEKRIAPAYILSLWLSHDRELLSLVNEINIMQFNLEDEMVYKYYFYKVPRGKRYIRWPKKTEKDKQEQKMVDDLRERYGISKREAKLLHSGTCERCGRQSLRLSDGLCFKCKFLKNKEDYIKKTAKAQTDIPYDPPMETAVIVEAGITEPPKKKRVSRKKKKE